MLLPLKVWEAVIYYDLSSRADLDRTALCMLNAKITDACL